ncbi:MAG: iron-containing alcohol dehydrogenase, partial [Ruthenibacterium sp.]
VIQFNAKNAEAAERYAEIARFIKLEGSTTSELVAALVTELRRMNAELNIPLSIQSYGEGGVIASTGIIDEKEYNEKLSRVAELAISDACTGSNPRQPSQSDMEKLLLAVYYDKEIDF